MKNIIKIISICLLINVTIIGNCQQIKATNEYVVEKERAIVEEYRICSEYEGLLKEINKYINRNSIIIENIQIAQKISELLEKDEYKDFLYHQKELSIDELKEKNYTNDQIEALKSFDGSDTLAIRASAYVYVSGGTMANSTTLHGTRFSWHWVGEPMLHDVVIQDGVAVRWRSSNQDSEPINTKIHSNTGVYVRYGNTKKTVSYTPHNTIFAAEAKFNTGGPDGSTLTYADSGMFDIYVTLPTGTKGLISNTIFEFKYAHTAWLFGGVSFGFPPNLGISVIEGEEETYKEWEVSN